MEWDGQCMGERARLQRKQEEKGMLLTPRLKSRESFSPGSRGSRGHWKHSGMRGAIGVGVGGEDETRLEVSLWGKREHHPRSRLTLPHRGCADFKCSIWWVVE